MVTPPSISLIKESKQANKERKTRRTIALYGGNDRGAYSRQGANSRLDTNSNKYDVAFFLVCIYLCFTSY